MPDIESHEYVRVDVIAQLFGVTARRVQQLTQDGTLPTINEPGKPRTFKCYDLYPTIQRYIQYLTDKAKGRSQSNDEEALKAQKLKAEVKLKESQAELHQLKTEIAAGKYLSVEEVKLEYGRFLTNFKKLALAIPNRVAGMIGITCDPVQIREIENDLNSEIINMLNAFVMAAQPEDQYGEKKKSRRGRPKKKDADTSV